MIQTISWRNTEAAPDAFPERQALMPIWGGVPLPQPQWQQIWQQDLAQPINEDALAYLHIPFCANHCVFCGFYRNAWKDGYSAVYADKVIEEMACEAEQRSIGGKIRAVYFGGGTPTALHSEDLARLIRACYRYLPLADDCEFTVEGRMSHFGMDKAQACIDAGATRISIGVQTFNTAIRKRLGRKNSGEEALAYLEKLCRLDAVIVADLMFGLPAQNDDVWQRDLELALSLPLSGLDTYAFNCYPFLPINRMIEKGAFPVPPGLDMQSRQYAYAVAYLREQGWQQVSNNHFAYPGRGERNLYNTLVKSNMPCLAFGSGAGGPPFQLSGAGRFEKLSRHAQRQQKPVVYEPPRRTQNPARPRPARYRTRPHRHLAVFRLPRSAKTHRPMAENRAARNRSRRHRPP